MFFILKNGFLASKQSLIQLFVLFFLAFIGTGAISLLGNSYESMNVSYNLLSEKGNIYDYSVGLASSFPVEVEDENKVREIFGDECPGDNSGCLFDAGLRKFNNLNENKKLNWNASFANIISNQINDENMILLNYFERSSDPNSLEIAPGVNLKNANSVFGNMNNPFVVEGVFNYKTLKDNEIFITSEYAKKNNLHPGDIYNFLGSEKIIVGTGIIPQFNVFRSSFNSVIPNYKTDNMVILNFRENIKYQKKLIVNSFDYDEVNIQNINYYGLAGDNFFGSYFIKNAGPQKASSEEIVTFFENQGLNINVDKANFLSDGSYGRWLTDNQFNLFIIIEIIGAITLIGILLYITILVTRSLLVRFLSIFGILKSNGYSASEISFSFVPLLFALLLVSCVSGNILAYYLQSAVTNAFGEIIQFPNLNLEINFFTLFYSIALPFFVAIISYFYCLWHLRKNIFDLFNSNQSSKAGFFVSKMGKIMSSKRIPFSLKIRTKMALNQVGKIALFGITVTAGGFLTLFGTIVSTSIDSFVNKTFEVRNYNYSYSVNSDFVERNADNMPFKIDSLESIKTNENKIASFEDLSENYTAGTMSGKWIPCGSDSSGNCWFENIPESYLPVLENNLAKFLSQMKILFPKLPNSFKYNPDGMILINRLGYEDTNTNVIGYEGLIGSINKTDSYLSARGVSSEVAGVDGTVNVDGKPIMQEMLKNKTEYEWDGNLRTPIKVATSSLFNIFHNVGIGDTITLNISSTLDKPKTIELLITDFSQDIAPPKLYILEETLVKLFAEKYSIPQIEIEPNILYTKDNILDTQLPIYYNSQDGTYTTSIWGSAIENSEQNLESIRKLNTALTQILLAISVLTILAALLVIFLICYVTIRENVKYIAMMNVLGYDKTRLLTLFVGVYIPIVILATAVALPSAYVVAHAVSNFVNSVSAGTSTFNLLIEFVPSQLVAVILGIVSVFAFCWMMSWIAIKRTNSLQIVQNSK